MNVAIIPARSGSKRIPGKNIKLFHGKPILSWPIECAIASGIFDRVIVTTDCQKIADIAEKAGAEVPFLRPADLAGDLVATVPVIQHAINRLELHSSHNVCCIYPTAVFLTEKMLRAAEAKRQALNADFVMPVVKFSCPIERALLMAPTGLLSMRNSEHINTRTQDCEALFHDIGQFYFGSVSAWLSKDPFYEQRVAAIEVPKYRAHDIDDEADWVLAELVFSQLHKLTELYA